MIDLNSEQRISIIGYHRSVMGLGEDARTLADASSRIGYRPELIDVSQTPLEPSREIDRFCAFEAETVTTNTVIFCLPPGDMQRAFDKLHLGEVASNRRKIGYWPWETSVLPAAFDHAFDLVDEIWASSRFLFDLYSSKRCLPVKYVPLSVTVEKPDLAPELKILFDGCFTVLSVFDFHSRIARKNPFGAIAAFRRAFPIGTEPVQLIIKTINGERRRNDLVKLLAATFQDSRISVVDGAVSRASLCGLIAASDVYLSLHRAEGFGRPVAEAMLLETPVVATQWSGTADFLDASTGYPVGSNLRPVRLDEYPWAAGLWADPDECQAADRLAELFHEPRARRRKCEAARQRLTALCGPAAIDIALRTALMRS